MNFSTQGVHKNHQPPFKDSTRKPIKTISQPLFNIYYR